MANEIKNTAPTQELASSTQDANQPVKGTRKDMVTPKIVVRPVNRQAKDIGVLRSAHIAAESVYYPNQSRLFDVYEDVLLDGFLTGIIRKRISQVVNKTLLFKKGEEEVPEMKKVMKSKAFKDVMRQIVLSKMWGLNGLEFVPGDKLKFNLIPKKHIKRKTQMITYEQTGLTEGISYVDLANIWIMGEPRDLGLLLMASYIVLLKKGVVSDWAQYIELFGSPAIVVKYKGYDQQAKIAADKVLDNIGNSMMLTIPEEMNVTFEDGKVSNGDGKLQETFRQACNEELSILMLGNTETTGHSKTGTGAKSKTHAEQQLEIIKDDMDDICDMLNSDHFMNILRSYGLPVEGGEFEFDHEVDIDFLEKKQTIDLALINVGLPVAKDYLYDTYAIPKPKPEDDLLEFPGRTEEPDDTGADGKTKPGVKPRAKAKTRPDSAPATIADIKAAFTDFFGSAR